MPRRPLVPQESRGTLSASCSSVRFAPDGAPPSVAGPAPDEIHSHATRVLTQAHAVLAQTDTQRCALQQCLALLHTVDAEALFFYHPTPAALTPAPGPGPKARKARRLQPLLTAALREVEARLEAIRLNALLTISRLGLPVALWHFVIPGPLPHTLAALAPRAAPPPLPDAAARQHPSPPRARARRPSSALTTV